MEFIKNKLTEKLEKMKMELEMFSEPWQALITEYTELRTINSPDAKQKFNEILAIQFKMRELQDTINSLENMLSPTVSSVKMDYTKEAADTLRELFEGNLNDDSPSMSGRK